MRRAILRIVSGCALGLAIYATDTAYEFSQLPPADNYCTAAGGDLERDGSGWWCNHHAAPAVLVTPALLDRGAER